MAIEVGSVSLGNVKKEVFNKSHEGISMWKGCSQAKGVGYANRLKRKHENCRHNRSLIVERRYSIGVQSIKSDA